jgi:deoxyribodipyrimidine photo-lyase
MYWMQRDQRVLDNWALLYAARVAIERQVPLLVLFNLVPVFGETTLRHYDFMFRGLAEVETMLRERQIAFFLTQGKPTETIPVFVAVHQVGEVVTDFNPLRFTNEWRIKVGELLNVRLTEVDAHNVIPCWVASDKQEFAAYTFRPKVHRQLSAFLTEFPDLPSDIVSTALPPPVAWEALLAQVPTNRTVVPVDWLTPGYTAGMERLEAFVTKGIYDYAEQRNDPNENALSHLSPYLHFGQIAPQRVALAVRDSAALEEVKEAYLEELIVRRELTDNFCLYNPQYDQVAGAHAWAQTTIAAHASDPRPYLYSATQLEAAETHDDLWNAMQRQMMWEGKMHGWCRMYWAKKIFEWSPDAQTAIDVALYLNDKYELDGTDPNGIVGVMWSICGVHDRAWNERPIFGKIRYMNYAGAKRKFDVAQFVAKYGNETLLFSS